MKKLMIAVLGLSLMSGLVVLAEDKPADKKESKKKAKKEAKKEEKKS